MPHKNFSSILIVSLDCVRREALGCYPHRFPWRIRIPKGVKTPNIDFLCNNGHRFDQAITQAPFTPVAHASLFTGLIPPNHGLRKFVGNQLSGNSPTLAEILSQKGWKCGAILGSHALSKEFGLARGFDFYDDDIETGIKRWYKGERRGASEVTDRGIAWLSSLNSDDRFFLFVHYFDAHNFVDQPHNDFTNESQSVNKVLRQKMKTWLPKPLQLLFKPVDRIIRSGYYTSLRCFFAVGEYFLSFFEAGSKFKREGRRFMLNAVANIDDQLGLILQTLVEQERLDSTLIIILADHGDDFMEHGEPTHRKYLYDTTLIVPLIIYPFFGGRPIISDQISLVDLFPTLMSILNIEIDNTVDGESLLPIIHDCEFSSRKAYSETIFELLESDKETDVLTCYASLRAYPWKLIWNRLDNSYELFRIDKDPGERNNIIKDYPKITTNMVSELRCLAQELPQGVNLKDNRLLKRLKALGYL